MMNKEFYTGNRADLYRHVEPGSLVIAFAGHAPIKSADEDYSFYANRNFVYLTGIEQKNTILMTVVGKETKEETLYILPPDAMAERWTGKRIKADAAEAISGITNFKILI